MKDPFARLALLIQRRRWIVFLAWGIVTGAAAPLLAPTAAGVLHGGGFVIQDSESERGNRLLGAAFMADQDKNVVVVFHSDSITADDPAFKAAVQEAEQRMRGATGVQAVNGYFDHGDSTLLSLDRHTAISVVTFSGDEAAAERLVPGLRDTLSSVPLQHYVTGLAASAHDSTEAALGDLEKSELYTFPVILVLLLVVFRTAVAALVPLVLGGCSVGLTVSVLALVGAHTETSIFALNVGSMVGLGLAIDYSLIVITRYREELAVGHDPRGALVTTMATAGRSVTYSGLTVIAAMLAMTVLLLPIMLVRSISLAVLLVAAVAVLMAVTLLPATLAIVGAHIERGRVIPRGRPVRPGEVGFWYRISQHVMGRAWLWLAASLLALALLASPLRSIILGGPDIPVRTEAADGADLMAKAFGGNRLSPIQVALVADGRDGIFTPQFLGRIDQLSTNLGQDPRVDHVYSLSTALSTLPRDQYLQLTRSSLNDQLAPVVAQFVNTGGDGTETMLVIIPRYDQFDQRTEGLVSDIRRSKVPAVSGSDLQASYVAGVTATFLDYKDTLYSKLPLIVGVLAALVFLVLLMFFQSLALPVKAVLMNILSVSATFGVLVAIFQWGWGAGALGFTSLSRITVISPAILYVILFALSTDYEVFMLSRVKEYFRDTGNNREAVAAGLQHSAGVITAAALVLIATFGTFALGRSIVIKEIGVGLAVGVLIDSTLVRVVLVPATMRLLGERNWWMPAFLKGIIPEISEEGAAELAGATTAVSPEEQAAAAAAVAHAVPAAAPAHAKLPEGTVAVLLPAGQWQGVDVVPILSVRPLRIGRDATNELRLPYLTISRNHARIDVVDGRLELTDLGSRNGVYVNGKRIPPRPEKTTLSPGDRIVIGGYGGVAFTVIPRRATAAPAAPAQPAAPPGGVGAPRA